jgi:hypothetical protein
MTDRSTKPITDLQRMCIALGIDEIPDTTSVPETIKILADATARRQAEMIGMRSQVISYTQALVQAKKDLRQLVELAVPFHAETLKQISHLVFQDYGAVDALGRMLTRLKEELK